MPRANYRIMLIDEFSYEVRVDDSSAGEHITTGFQSIAEAENWIEIQKRHEPRVGLGPPAKACRRHSLSLPGIRCRYQVYRTVPVPA
jgi:hypothetical protein